MVSSNLQERKGENFGEHPDCLTYRTRFGKICGMENNLQIPYGIFDFKRIRTEGYCYIDKTGYIPALEQSGSFLFFVRPRRFGKSLFINMLRCYYDLAEKDNFERLFGGLAIAAKPTRNANRFQVLYMDFSEVNRGVGATLPERFESYVGDCLKVFLSKYGHLYGDALKDISAASSFASQFTRIAKFAKEKDFHLYLMLDEYDNFTNAMLRAEESTDYRSITHGQGFYREWFKVFKSSFDRIFMTGVSPVTMDDLTSGFNIALNISQDPDFNAMLGFSEEEVLKLYTDFKGTGRYQAGDPAEWVKSIKHWYDGYCFSKSMVGKESVFNSDMALYHLSALVKTGQAPENMERHELDHEVVQLKNCERYLRKTYAPSLMSVKSVFQEVLENGDVAISLLPQFDFEAVDDQRVFLSLFVYYGLLTLSRCYQGLTYYRFPNEWCCQQAIRIVDASRCES